MTEYISKIKEKYSNYVNWKYSYYVNYICGGIIIVFIFYYFIFRKSFEESLAVGAGVGLGSILVLTIVKILKGKLP